jgi:predicted ATP-dependent protease
MAHDTPPSKPAKRDQASSAGVSPAIAPSRTPVTPAGDVYLSTAAPPAAAGPGSASVASPHPAGVASGATTTLGPPVPVPSPSSLELLAKAWSEAATASHGRARETTRVDPARISHRTEPSLLPEVPRESRGLFELVSPIARRALELALAAREPSFHGFVAAHPEVMIEDDIVRYAERFARARPAPPDIVYVHDFDQPEAPRPLVLPAGAGALLVQAMGALIAELREAVPALVEAEPLRRAQADLTRRLEAKNKLALTDLESTAKTLGFGVRSVHGGVQTFPILHGKPLSAEQFDVLDESTKRALSDAEERLTSEVEKVALLVRAQGARFEQERDETFRKAAAEVIEDAFQKLEAAFESVSAIVGPYFAQVKQALSEDWEDLIGEESSGGGGGGSSAEDGTGGEDHDPEHATRLRRFEVNLLVSHVVSHVVQAPGADTPTAAAPVLYDTNPTYPNMFGYLERRARFGALVTDFMRIRAGSLHRASGGVLVVRAADLMADPIIWERMKRVLREQRIGAEDPLGPLGLYATSLRPVPVPIRVRVILVGTPDLYAALLDADADFAALFRIKVEVEPYLPRTKASLLALDAYLMAMAKERGWGHFDRAARARLLDLATRLSGERDRLALSLAPLEETAAFASAAAAARAIEEELAGEPSEEGTSDEGSEPDEAGEAGDARQAEEGAESGEETEESVDERSSIAPVVSMPPPAETVVTVEDIDDAWRDRRERAGAAERHIRDLTLRGEVALDTQGTRVGVVNGLSVYSAGDVEFGQPMRITAVVALGREGIIDVEREAQLGGAIHTKGVAILRGYLGRMFGQERPLSLRAQIAFEQSYGEIDGDSASSSELFAVLSALADVGIDQGIAVTGSVNQLGEVQAIGGLCAKIEGFFDLCVARGLSGGQGVLMPKTNLSHLVLRDDVAEAIEDGTFHLYSIATVTQGIEILTGLPAGERDASGRFPAWSLFGRVERRIIEIAERLREAEGHRLNEVPPDRDSTAGELEGASDFRGR